jgi:RimJ/RimL family protein N-acetyltransferase
MTNDLGSALARPPALGTLRLERLHEGHRAALKAACAEDEEIWPLYPVSFDPDHFGAAFDAVLADRNRVSFAVIDQGRLIGMSAYLRIEPEQATLEIGATYLVPSVRGTGLNGQLKQLMLGHAFANGIRRVTFRVDDRNARSKAAVAKIGGVREGLLRADRVTWTGHIRDTVIFSILAHEWHGRRS